MHRMKWHLFAFIAVLPCAVYLPAPDTASVVGTVTDTTGAVVPGASIELANPATGKIYKTVTSDSGSYTFANVTPGPGYKETVSRNGFQTTVLTDLYMNVTSTRRQNIKLAVGS